MGRCEADGRCPSVKCTTAEEPCFDSSQCCSRRCMNDGTGTRTCALLDGCRPLGESCIYSHECCSGSCQADSTSRSYRCVPTDICVEPGELCNSNMGCCGGPERSEETSCELGGSNVFRCVRRDAEEKCRPERVECSHASECCGEYCIPNSDGHHYCSSQCVAEGRRCSSNLDCCSGLVCITGVCGTNEYSCAPFGASCEDEKDCCEGPCDFKQRRCIGY